MVGKSVSKRKKDGPGTPPYHERFSISTDLEDAQKQFVNRLLNLIDNEFPVLQALPSNRSLWADNVLEHIALNLGVRYYPIKGFIAYSGEEYTDQILKSVEVLCEASYGFPEFLATLDEGIKSAISMSEVDLGIEWRDGVFWRSGAKLLDEELVNEPLRWLAAPKYKNVLEPFQKGLRHYLEASRDPKKLSDTITDMYEALEALARIANHNNSTLGANAENFISNLELDPHYAKMLKDYCEYAHQYRHAAKQDQERITPKPQEVEAFIYATGLFIRLAIRQSAEE